MKTIGDAVMAVSRRPVAALVAVLDAQAVLAQPAGAARRGFDGERFELWRVARGG